MTPPVFTEVDAPAWAFWRAVKDAVIGAALGVLFLFLGAVTVGIVGEESLPIEYADAGLDPVFRAAMGVVLAAAGVLLLIIPLLIWIERFAALRAVERAATAQPNAVPQRVLRVHLATPPARSLKLAGTIIMIAGGSIGGLLLLAIVFTDEFRADPVIWSVVAGLAGLTVVGNLIAGWAHRARGAEEARLHRESERWDRLIEAAEAADRQRRSMAPAAALPAILRGVGDAIVARVYQVLGVLSGVVLGAFWLSVFLRQQCRRCEPITWNRPMENGIDVLSLASGVGIAVCVAAWTFIWLGAVVMRFAQEIALARWASGGGVRRVDLKRIRPFITDSRALVIFQLGVASLGGMIVIFGVGVDWAASDLVSAPLTVLLGAALLVVAVVSGWSDAPRARRERILIRGAVAPGDMRTAAEVLQEQKRAGRSGTGRRRTRRPRRS